jgi:hypothetical protein
MDPAATSFCPSSLAIVASPLPPNLSAQPGALAAGQEVCFFMQNVHFVISFIGLKNIKMSLYWIEKN